MISLQQLAAMADCRDSDHPIAEECTVGLGDRVPEVDPDPELDPVLRRGPRVCAPIARCRLTAHPNGIDHAGKLSPGNVERRAPW